MCPIMLQKEQKNQIKRNFRFVLKIFKKKGTPHSREMRRIKLYKKRKMSSLPLRKSNHHKKNKIKKKMKRRMSIMVKKKRKVNMNMMKKRRTIRNKLRASTNISKCLVNSMHKLNKKHYLNLVIKRNNN